MKLVPRICSCTMTDLQGTILVQLHANFIVHVTLDIFFARRSTFNSDLVTHLSRNSANTTKYMKILFYLTKKPSIFIMSSYLRLSCVTLSALNVERT